MQTKNKRFELQLNGAEIRAKGKQGLKPIK